MVRPLRQVERDSSSVGGERLDQRPEYVNRSLLSRGLRNVERLGVPGKGEEVLAGEIVNRAPGELLGRPPQPVQRDIQHLERNLQGDRIATAGKFVVVDLVHLREEHAAARYHLAPVPLAEARLTRGLDTETNGPGFRCGDVRREPANTQAAAFGTEQAAAVPRIPAPQAHLNRRALSRGPDSGAGQFPETGADYLSAVSGRISGRVQQQHELS